MKAKTATIAAAILSLVILAGFSATRPTTGFDDKCTPAAIFCITTTVTETETRTVSGPLQFINIQPRMYTIEVVNGMEGRLNFTAGTFEHGLNSVGILYSINGGANNTVSSIDGFGSTYLHNFVTFRMSYVSLSHQKVAFYIHCLDSSCPYDAHFNLAVA